MTREEKTAKRILRKQKRVAKRQDKWQEIKRLADSKGIPVFAARGTVRRGWAGAWPDENSPTGYTQVCSYWNTCQYPCNGDC